MIKKYLLNPDFIVNVLYLTVFLFITYKVLGDTLWVKLKKKLNPWDQSDEKDFDRLIKRKMDLLKANSGFYVPEDESLSSSLIRKAKKNNSNESIQMPVQIKNLIDDLSWGNGEEVKKIIKLFQREFNYTPNEKSTRDKIKLYIKEKAIFNQINQNSREEIITLLYNRTLLNYYLDEIAEGRFNLIKKFSTRLNVPADLIAYSIQYTLLQNHKMRFSNELTWNRLSLNERNSLTENFLITSSLSLSKSVNALNEIIKTNFPLADFLRPWSEINKDSNIDQALLVLRAHQSFSIDDIKKNYKKLVQEKHPDKIMALNLPKEIEANALKQFQIIQAAMDLIQKSRGK